MNAPPERHCLEELGHQQPATQMRTDNQTAKGFIRGTIKQKRSRTFDRQCWWLKDRESQLQFNVTWDPGIHKLADYFTKHHPGCHHKRFRPIYLHEEDSPTDLQGCIRILVASRLRVGSYANATNLRIGQNMVGSCFNQLSKVIQQSTINDNSMSTRSLISNACSFSILCLR